MKKLLVSVFIMVMAGAVLALSPVWGLDEHLSVNPYMTTRIHAFDPEDFTKDFDVYAAEVLEAPLALLFDMKDDYHLPSKFWGEPLSHEEIIYAIRRLDDQYINNVSGELVFELRALNVVNVNSKFLGYVYTSLKKAKIVTERLDDGNVKVFPPEVKTESGGSGGGGQG